MSDLLKHLIVADLLGQILSNFNRSWLNKSIFALLIGFSSHIVLDYIDNEFVVNWFNIHELKYAIPFVIFQIIFSSVLLVELLKNSRRNISKYSRQRVFFIIGAVMPDIIDGIYSIVNPNAWYSGQLMFPWHISRSGAGNVMSMYNTIILICVFIIVRYFFVLKGWYKRLK